MPYSQTTLGAFSTEIVNTLSDPTYNYWSPAEITLAVQEAMRDWSAKTSYWRNRGSINVVKPSSVSPAKYFYDLSVELPGLRPRTITIDSILTEIQYHLLEAANGYSGTGLTDQFTITEMIQAVVRARNRFCLDAMIPLTLTPQLSAVVDPSGRFPLPENSIYCHRLMWIDQNGAYYPLYRSDAFAMDAASPYWLQAPARPSTFSQAETMPIQIQLDPVPISGGVFEMLSVESIHTFAQGASLGVPDDYAHAIKYAAMAYILSVDADAANPFLVAYCDFRYNEIVAAAKNQQIALRLQLNNRPVGFAPLFSLDSGRPSWHSISGTPNAAATANEMIAFAPSANGVYGCTIDLVQSAPVPISNVSTIQMGLEELENILDYCQHYLSIKMAGTEFRDTFGLFDGFQKQCNRRSGIVANQARYLTSLFGQANWDQAKNPDAISSNLQPALIGSGQ